MSTSTTPGQGGNPPSLGFEMIERMLHEFRDTKRSQSLEKLVTAANDQIDRYTAQQTAPASQRDAASVKEAIELGRQLVVQIATEATQKGR
ncbi:MAG: hypothetical protein ACAI43_25410 [Phycisphaerae bacterium]|nr:hypothetical protein [Tepidisphaeraceae bacterium]